MVRVHSLFKINIAEQGTSHRIIATHRNLDRMRGQWIKNVEIRLRISAAC
jgi:hypothetical protein